HPRHPDSHVSELRWRRGRHTNLHAVRRASWPVYRERRRDDPWWRPVQLRHDPVRFQQTIWWCVVLPEQLRIPVARRAEESEQRQRQSAHCGSDRRGVLSKQRRVPERVESAEKHELELSAPRTVRIPPWVRIRRELARAERLAVRAPGHRDVAERRN